MYPVSADFHNLSIADAPTSRVRIYFIEANVDCTDDNDVQSNGTLLCMPGETDSNGRIEKGGVTINEFFNSDANVQIGATVSSQIGMTLINRDGALDGFNYGRCKVYIDVYDDTNSTWLTCPMGVYNIAIPKRRKVQLVSATGYDQMQQLDEIADSWWNGLDWSNGITLLQIIQSMAATLGIHLSANTSANIVNSGLSYTEIPFTAIEMTYRDILSYIAETTGTIARFDRNGALDLRWFSDAVLSTDTQTYAGGLVTFTATDRASISSLSVPFSPIQDLHGYANPWPAGGGKNLLNPSLLSFQSSGYVWTDYYSTIGAISVSPSTDYVLSFKQGIGDGRIYQFDSDGNQVGTEISFTNPAKSFSTESNCVKISFRYKVLDHVRPTVDTSEPMLELGTSSTTFSPYSNICPITGRTGLSVYRTGKNMCVPDLANGQIGSNGGYSSNTSRLTNAVHVDNAYVSNTYLSAGTYTLSVDGLTQCTVLTKDASANIIDNFATAWHGLPYTFTMTAAGYVFFTVKKSSGDLNPDDYKAQIESGSTATTYEPYNGNTYAVDWATEAGTVYGGTLDVVTGVLTVDKKYFTQSGDVLLFGNWGHYNAPLYYFLIDTTIPIKIYADTQDDGYILTNYFSASTGIGPDRMKNNEIRTRYDIPDRLYFRWDSAGSLADINAAFAENPLQIVAELATPLTYQLTPQEVETLVGTNNVWSTGDSVSVTVAEPNLVEIQTDTVGNQCLSIDVGEYQVSQIDALSVKASQADVGVTIGSGGNAYTILDNPMLFGDEAAITTKATPIYNRLSAFRLFTPISMRCIMDWSIEAGDIITVTNESVTYDLPIFQQRLRWRGGYVVSDLFSSGEQERPTQSKEIRSSFRSNTQMHEFEVTLEQLRSYIQSVDGNYTLIQQTVDAITQTVANQNVTIQNILDPTGEIWTAITKNTSNLSSIEDSLNNEITERKSYIRFIPSEPAIVMGVDEDNEIKLKLVNNIIYFFNGADDSTDLSLAYAYFNSQEAFADRFVAGESVQIGTNDNAAHWLWKKLNNGDLVLELVG